MKKLWILVAAVLLAVSMTACSAAPSAPAEPTPEPVKIESALELLNTVWAGYADEDKFSAAGGDFNEENMTMDAPGKFGVEDAEALDATLGLPQDKAAAIDDAASLMHMMNANTFTCGAFRVKSGEDMAAFTTALENSIMSRQWMCGFPETLIIYTVDSYVVSAFGNGEIIDTFEGYLTSAYEGAAVVCDKPIA